MSENWICQNCGHENPVIAKVCGKCSALKGTVETFEKNGTEYIRYNIVVKRNAEQLLETLALAILIVGIICSVILAFYGMGLYSDHDKEEAYWCFWSILPVMLTSATVYALLKVICNISDTLQEIKNKI